MGLDRGVAPVGRGRGRTVLAVLAMVAAVVAGACGGGGGSGTRVQSSLDQVRAALRDRVGLLVDGDVDGYMATVGPNARKLEQAIAEGAAAVPLSYANVTVTPEGSRTPTHVGNAVVEVVYRYERLPEDNLFRFELSYDVDLQNGKWMVTTSLAAGERPLPVWATGPVAVEQSEHFLALYRPGLPKVTEALAVAEDARAGLATRLEVLRSDPVHLVLLAGSEEEYAQIKGTPTSDGELAAAGALFLPLATPENRRMIIKAHRLVDESAATTFEDGERAPPKTVFQHELGHLALARIDGPFTPGWVAEGAAMYLAGERRLAAWRFSLEHDVFDDVSIESMGSDPSLADGTEYAYVNAAALYLIEEFGPERFFDFYRGFLPVGVTEQFRDDPTGVVLAGTYDLSAVELDIRTRQYLENAVAAG